MSDSKATVVDIQTQLDVDTFYWAHGPCCAGCDWWRHYNDVVGDCTKSMSVPGHMRMSLLDLGLRPIGYTPNAGPLMTSRSQRCGDFADTFDWQSLPASYLQRIKFKGQVNV